MAGGAAGAVQALGEAAAGFEVLDLAVGQAFGQVRSQKRQV